MKATLEHVLSVFGGPVFERIFEELGVQEADDLLSVQPEDLTMSVTIRETLPEGQDGGDKDKDVGSPGSVETEATLTSIELTTFLLSKSHLSPSSSSSL